MKNIISKITCVVGQKIASIFMEGQEIARIQIKDGKFMAEGKSFDRVEQATAAIIAERITANALGTVVPGINMLKVSDDKYYFSRNNVMFPVCRKEGLWYHVHNYQGFETVEAAAADRARNL
jgi:hypothetical protein